MQKVSDRTAFNIIIIIILLLASSAGVLMAQTISTVTPTNDTLLLRINNPNTTYEIATTKGSRVLIESSISGAAKATTKYLEKELVPTYWNYDELDMIEVKKLVYLNNLNVHQHVKIYIPASIKAVIDEADNVLN
jgi:hypothetical protein